MAGIVASTLRRKAFHRGTRTSEQNKAALAAAAAAAAVVATDSNVASYSPSASRRSSRSSSYTGCRPDDGDDRLAYATHAGQVGNELKLKYLMITREIKLLWKYFANISVFISHVIRYEFLKLKWHYLSHWNSSDIILKYFNDIEHVGKYSWAKIISATHSTSSTVVQVARRHDNAKCMQQLRLTASHAHPLK